MWKVDSSKITEYNASNNKLEALIIFWILAAGKTAKGAERILGELVKFPLSPFYQINHYKSPEELSIKLKELGCGCHGLKGKSIWSIANSGLDLNSCTISDLELIPGIGKKTSRAFVVHSRKNAQHAIIDTHILKFLQSEKVKNVPKSTPGSKKEYERLEQEFLQICKNRNRIPAEYDLEIWKSYRK